MISILQDTPSNIAAFVVEGQVTKEDFETVVFPTVEKLVEKTGKLNYLMVIDTPLSSFTPGAWMQDALLGIKKLDKWHKAAILTDSETINTFTNYFSKVVPGEFRGYKKNQLEEAIQWVSS